MCRLRTKKKADPRVDLTHRLGPRFQAEQNRAQLDNVSKGLHILRKGRVETQRPNSLTAPRFSS